VGGRIFGFGASKREPPAVARGLNLFSKPIIQAVQVSNLNAGPDEHEMRAVARHGQDRVTHKGGGLAARLGDISSHAAGSLKEQGRFGH
jgi:hypothetical protein